MNEGVFSQLLEWLTQSALAGASGSHIVSGFCERCVEGGLPLGRAQVFIDTLHPIHEGRLFRWGSARNESSVVEYGRTSLDALAAAGTNPKDVEAAERWQHSPFYKMLQTGDSL